MLRPALAFLALVVALAGSSPAFSVPGPQWAADSPRDKLLGDERLRDPRDPLSNLRARREAGNQLRGVFDGCPHAFDVLHYELFFSNVDLFTQNLTGHTVVRFVSRVDNLASVELDFKPNLTVSSVLEESITPLSFTHVGDVLDIDLSAPADSGDTVAVDVSYSGTPWNEGAGGFGGFWFGLPNTSFSMGVGLFTDPPSMGRAWFPCYDRPCDKATVDLHITTPLNLMGVANGALVDVDTTATTYTWNWSHDFPISTYLIAIAVAPYRVYPDSNDSRITYYHHPGYRKAAEVSFQFVDQMMDAYELKYGAYPYEKFAYMTAPKGDMEHQTCVTHQFSLVDSTNFYDDILSHELSHMWFGDCVTYGDWRDVWLSEGFATYSEAVWREAKNGIGDYHNYVTTQLLNRVINSGVTDGIYDPSSLWGVVAYEKGGSLLHMLRGVLDNDALFFQALRDYKINHEYGNAVTTDCVASINASVGQNLDWFFDPWLYGDGHPLYEYGWSFDPLGGGQYKIDVVIRQKQTTGTLFDMPVDFRVLTSGGPFNFSERINLAEETVSFIVPSLPTGLLVDPNDWILDEQQLAPTSADFSAEAQARQTLALEAPRPNPAGMRAELRYYMPQSGEAVLEVFDLSGRRVRELFRGTSQAGSRAVFWDRRNDAGGKVAGGMYWIRLTALGEVRTRSVAVLD